ncbi:MAG: hypothetical protein ACREQF_06170 [Candidatus Binataceae bacterium]
MPVDPAAEDPFVRLTENLRELEVVIGEKARPVVAEVRAGLTEALRLRERGEVAGALSSIRRAMERLASLATELDAGEGLLMRAIAERFTQALDLGRKGDTKEAVNLMRRKAGDTKDEPNTEW